MIPNTASCATILKKLTLGFCGLAFLVILQLLYGCVLPLLLLAVIGLLCYRFDIKHFSLLLCLGSLAITIFFALAIETPVSSDFYRILSSAQDLVVGERNFLGSDYFLQWPYQMAWVVYETAILAVWNNPLAIRLAGCLCFSLCNVIFYQMATTIFSKKSSQVMSIFHLLFLFHTTYVTVLNNSIPSAFFLYLGIYVIICQRPRRFHPLARYALAGAVISLGNLIRPEGIIILLAILASFVIECFQRASKKTFRQVCARGFLLLATYLLVATVASQLVVATGLSQYGLSNNDPLWKVVTGLNAESKGGYSSADWALLSAMEEEGIPRAEAEWSLITERLQASPFQMLQLFGDKISYFWSPNSLYWSLGHLSEYSPDLYSGVVLFNQQIYQITLLLAFFGVVELWRKKKFSAPHHYLIPLIILATFFCYLVVEVQSRYSYTVQWCLFFMACGGLDFLLAKGKRYPSPSPQPKED